MPSFPGHEDDPTAADDDYARGFDLFPRIQRLTVEGENVMEAIRPILGDLRGGPIHTIGIEAPMGSGKTEFMRRTAGERFCVLTPQIGLSQSLAGRLRARTRYDGGPGTDHPEVLVAAKRVVACVHSLAAMSDRVWEGSDLVVDECMAVLTSLGVDPHLKQRRARLLSSFGDAISRSKQCFLMDAHLTPVAVAMAANFAGVQHERVLYLRVRTPAPGGRSIRYKSRDGVVQAFLEAVRRGRETGRYPALATTGSRSAARVEQLAQGALGGLRPMLVTADTINRPEVQQFLLAVSRPGFRPDRPVIFSPAIGSGVSFDVLPDGAPCFAPAFFLGQFLRGVPMDTYQQMIARVRGAIELHWWIAPGGTRDGTDPRAVAEEEADDLDAWASASDNGDHDGPFEGAHAELAVAAQELREMQLYANWTLATARSRRSLPVQQPAPHLVPVHRLQAWVRAHATSTYGADRQQTMEDYLQRRGMTLGSSEQTFDKSTKKEWKATAKWHARDERRAIAEAGGSSASLEPGERAADEVADPWSPKFVGARATLADAAPGVPLPTSGVEVEAGVVRGEFGALMIAAAQGKLTGRPLEVVSGMLFGDGRATELDAEEAGYRLIDGTYISSPDLQWANGDLGHHQMLVALASFFLEAVGRGAKLTLPEVVHHLLAGGMLLSTDSLAVAMASMRRDRVFWSRFGFGVPEQGYARSQWVQTFGHVLERLGCQSTFVSRAGSGRAERRYYAARVLPELRELAIRAERQRCAAALPNSDPQLGSAAAAVMPEQPPDRLETEEAWVLRAKAVLEARKIKAPNSSRRPVGAPRPEGLSRPRGRQESGPLAAARIRDGS